MRFNKVISILNLFFLCALSAHAAFNAKDWNVAGRAKVSAGANSLTVENGLLYSKADAPADAEYSFKLRAPEGAKKVQLWAGFKVKDAESRYVVALRGAPNRHVYLARYAPDGNAKFLGFANLDFELEAGKWYDLRVLTSGDRIQVYVNNEDLPRLNVKDEALWEGGGIGLGGGYLPAEFASYSVKPLDGASLEQFKSAGDKFYRKAQADKETIRAKNRSSYSPQKLEKLNGPRTELSLDGDWLFYPIEKGKSDDATASAQPDLDDSSWHTLKVPSMWTPCLAWLHGEESFRRKDVPKEAYTKGIYDTFYNAEFERVDNLSFNWDKTNAGWYRHYIDLPQDIKGKKLELHFDAVAQSCEVFVNGKSVGGHVGMFGEFVCDITEAAKPGRNVIAVHVIRRPEKSNKTANQSDVIAVEITVAITNEMVSTLPKGFYLNNPAGIWQPVKLVVTSPASVSDIFVKPQTDGADIEIELSNSSKSAKNLRLAYIIRDKSDASVLYENLRAASVKVPQNGKATVNLKTPKLSPKLWTPSTPNMYEFEVAILDGGKVADKTKVDFGFRTFKTEGNRFILNGKPIWLRGGNHTPAPYTPNDAKLANKFVSLARDGNVNITRTHVAPMSRAWIDAANRGGLMVSYEGIWPWLMHAPAGVPEKSLEEAWRNNYSELIKKYRNDPAVVMWTVNNEMKFLTGERDMDSYKAKWEVLDRMMKQMRKLDPTRPIVADSAYCRKSARDNYEKVIKANDFDDGDVDDFHNYSTWYNESFFHHYYEPYKNLASPDRPLISQELATGYPNNDDGLPCRYYTFDRYVPQGLVGDYAYDNSDPKYFLTSVAFNTKQLAEVVRRYGRDYMAGVLHFAYLTWYKNVCDAKTVEPMAPAKELKKALSPVLLSAELFGTHFYFGDTLTQKICIANDSEDCKDLPPSDLLVEVVVNGKAIASQTFKAPSVKYYSNEWLDNLKLKIPEVNLGRTEAKLRLTLKSGGKIIAQNDYDILLASRKWAFGDFSRVGSKVVLYNPEKLYEDVLDNYGFKSIDNLKNLSNVKLLIVVGKAALQDASANGEILKFVRRGGKLLALNCEDSAMNLLEGTITKYRKSPEGGARPKCLEIMQFKAPEHAAFDGLEPLDLRWFENPEFDDKGRRKIPYAATGYYQFDRSKPARTICEFVNIHVDLGKEGPSASLKFTGSTILEVKEGKGEILLSEVAIGAANTDFVAARLLSNMIRALLK